MYFQQYTPSHANMLIANNKTQLAWNKWTSEINESLGNISVYGPTSIDNCIENGAIYLANLSENALMKINENGTLNNSIPLTSPILVSSVNLKIGKKLYSDDGVWVLTSSGDLSKYDKNLTLESTVSGFTQSSFISSDCNGKCAIANNDLQKIFIVNEDGSILSSFEYSSFNPSITNDNLILKIQFDANSDLFVLTKQYLYKIETNSEYGMYASGKYDIRPLIDAYEYVISDMDIDWIPDRFAENESSSSFSEGKDYYQDIYVSCGDYNGILVLNFDNTCALIRQKDFSSQEYPYIMRVGKGKFSNGISILADRSRFIEPETSWESSSTSTSSSSIYPSNVFISNGDSTKLSKLDLNSFNINFLGNHIVLGSKVLALNPNNNRVYYVSVITNEIYYYDLDLETNVLVGTAPTTNICRIAISPDATKLWLSKDSSLWICNISDGAILNTVTLKSTTLADIDAYGGMELHPTNNRLYLASGSAIYYCDASAINTTDTIAYFYRISTKPVISTYITDITFADSGEMFIADYKSAISSRIFMVNYEEPIITYTLMAEENELIEALSSGTGL